ncbi:MAG: SRPBCC family protein [Parvibaculum sp.]
MDDARIDIMVVMAFDAPAERVWAVVGDYGDTSGEFGSGFVAAVEVQGEGVGALRTLHLAPDRGGGTVVERQTARDERGMYYAYELAERGPMPVTEYYGTAQVIPVSATSCKLVWTNRYRPDGAPAEALRAQSLETLDILERNLKGMLARRAG